MPMLEGEKELTLELLNESSQGSIERDYNAKEHSSTREAPRSRALRGPSVGRTSPTMDELRSAFRREVVRKQRRSDGKEQIGASASRWPRASGTSSGSA